MILSHAKIEEIAAAVIKDFNLFFFGEKASEARSMPQGTPIDQFASEYLRLKISFEKLSADGSLCGLTSYEDTEYAIEENGVSRTIPLKRNQVLLDSSFIAPGNVRKLCGKRRFTLAHECAHQLLFHLESEDTKAACRKLYAERRTYSLRDLKSNEDWNEWQANVLGAAILMPQSSSIINMKNIDLNTVDRDALVDIRDVKVKGRVNCIVVKDLSRFGRNYKETGNYLERIFPFLGVRFIAVNDNFDTLTAERTQDGYIVPLKNLINEVYSKDISKKSASALHVKQQRGEFIGAWAPYGYSKGPNDKHHLVINKETAPTVRQIFKWRSEGISVVQIGRRLNDAGILSPSAYLYETGEVKTEKYKGVLWHTQIIKSILAHPVYIGHMVQGRKKQSFYEGKRQTYVDEANWIIVRNTHEPIIDEETFEKVQQIANQRKSEYHERLGKFAHLKHSENILQGLVWCPNCQRPLVRYKNVSHGKKLWYTYICPGHADDPNRCSFVSIREDELNEVLFTAIQSQIQIAADLQEVIKRLNAEPEYRRQRSDAASKLETARRTLKRSQSLYDSLYQNYVEQLMTEQEYVTLKARYKAETEKAEQLIAALEQEQKESKVYTAENRFLTEFRSFMGTDKLTKEMASALVERIYVDADRNIDIRLRYRDEYMALLKFIEGRAAV